MKNQTRWKECSILKKQRNITTKYNVWTLVKSWMKKQKVIKVTLCTVRKFLIWVVQHYYESVVFLVVIMVGKYPYS